MPKAMLEALRSELVDLLIYHMDRNSLLNFRSKSRQARKHACWTFLHAG